jgi:hypothetical protein
LCDNFGGNKENFKGKYAQFKRSGEGTIWKPMDRDSFVEQLQGAVWRCMSEKQKVSTITNIYMDMHDIYLHVF